MLQTVEGIYRDGIIELLETPGIKESRVIITFLNENGQDAASVGSVDLTELGISKEQAAQLRATFSTFAEDWERPEMDVYDRL